MRIAAIDIGTVTSRLLVADVEGRIASGEAGEDAAAVDATRGPVLREVLRDLQITHLGEGIDASGTLASDAIDRTSAAVGAFVARAREARAERIVAIATSASRDAANAGTLVRRLASLGAPVEVIDGDREAYLSFLGATYSLSGEGMLVADLGGGSTELVYGRRTEAGLPEVQLAHSFDVGSKRLTERILRGQHPPEAERLREGYEWVRSEMGPFFDSLPGAPRLLVSLAGTATSLSALNLGMVDYDPARVHGSVLTAEDLRRLFGRLAALTLDELREVPGLHPGRASVIVAGTLILRAVLELSALHSTMVSEHDILYGIALDAYAGGRQ